jgi:hypothetical protein
MDDVAEFVGVTTGRENEATEHLIVSVIFT